MFTKIPQYRPSPRREFFLWRIPFSSLSSAAAAAASRSLRRLGAGAQGDKITDFRRFVMCTSLYRQAEEQQTKDVPSFQGNALCSFEISLRRGCTSSPQPVTGCVLWVEKSIRCSLPCAKLRYKSTYPTFVDGGSIDDSRRTWFTCTCRTEALRIKR